MFGDDRERRQGLKSVESLLALIREHVIESGEVQLYAVWNGNESRPPKGEIAVALDALERDTFFLNEQFLYRVTV